MRPIRRAAVTGLFALWLAPLDHGAAARPVSEPPAPAPAASEPVATPPPGAETAAG